MFVLGWNDGHTLTGAGTGAVGLIKETDRNRRIGSKVKSILMAEYENIKIINCTIDKSSNDMADAVKIANNNKCDLFISNHVNAGGGVGFESFYSRYSTAENIRRGKIIHDTLCKTKSCLKNRRYMDDYSYKGYDLYVLRNTKMDALLCEIGFVDNANCVKAINDDEVARAYVDGIASAYGLKKKSIDPTSCGFKVGDLVKVTGKKWVTGQVIPTWVKSNQYKIKEISGSKLLLDSVNSWVYNIDVVKVGESNGVYHTVVNGDTLWAISKKYGVNVDQIKKLNNLTSNIINVGKKLKIK